MVQKTKILIVIGVLLILSSFFLPWLKEQPSESLEARKIFLNTYSYCLVAALAVVSGLLLDFKKGSYWIALATIIFSFRVQLTMFFFGFWILIFMEKEVVWALSVIGHIIILVGLLLYKLQELQHKIHLSFPLKQIVLVGLNILILIVGFGIETVVLALYYFLLESFNFNIGF